MAADSQAQARIGAGGSVDWQDWHASYERPSSPLAQRLALVQRHVAAAIARRAPGPVSLISVCAGQGHDLIGALREHPRREDVRGRLVELDEANVAAARTALQRTRLAGIEVVRGDASLVDAYAGAVPADLILLCGVLGNISKADVERTVALLPTLCAVGADVVWTRNRSPPDLVPDLLEMLTAAGFHTPSVDDGPNLAIATSRLHRPPLPPAPSGTRLFEFIGQRALWPHLPERTRARMLALFDTDGTLSELIEAVRAIPLGGAVEQSVEQMLRDGLGTPVAKHMLLADMLHRRFPQTAPRVILRLCRLNERQAHELHGPAAAATLREHGGEVRDVHCYLTAVIDGRRACLDVSLSGEPWDGHSDLRPVCGAGDDRPLGENPQAQLEQLLEEVREDPVREAFEAALGEQSLDLPQRQPSPQA